MEINDSPEYFRYPIAEFKGNPLIEALRPFPADDEEAVRRLIRMPYFSPEERNLEGRFRMAMTERLKHFFFPKGPDVDILNRIYLQVLSGYVLRNPASADGQRRLYNVPDSDGMMHTVRESPIHHQASISFITGPSGIGKSVLISAIMNAMGKQVIRHKEYEGRPFTESQIVWLKRNVPDQCSAKALCRILADETDRCLGVDMYGKMFSNKLMNRTEYVSLLRRILVNHHVGCLILDDFQNLSQAKSGGKEELLSLFLNLREELGVPLILIGTYESASVMTGNASIARRFAEGGFHNLKLPARQEDDDWKDLCEVVWKYQWVRNPAELTDDIVSCLYEHSKGITAIMLQLFIDAQVIAIASGGELVDSDTIRSAYENNSPIKSIVTALHAGDRTAYEDLYLAISPENNPMARTRLSQVEEQIDAVRNSLKNGIGRKPKPALRKSKPQPKNARPEAVDEALAMIGSSDGSSVSDFIDSPSA